MKKFLVVMFCCICLVGCGEKKEEKPTNSNSNSTDNTIIQAKTCCIDNGGVWKNDACVEGGSGFFDRDDYNSCLKYAIGSTD